MARIFTPTVVTLALQGLKNAQSPQAQAPPPLSPTQPSLEDALTVMSPSTRGVQLNPKTRQWRPFASSGTR